MPVVWQMLHVYIQFTWLYTCSRSHTSHWSLLLNSHGSTPAHTHPYRALQILTIVFGENVPEDQIKEISKTAKFLEKALTIDHGLVPF